MITSVLRNGGGGAYPTSIIQLGTCKRRLDPKWDCLALFDQALVRKCHSSLLFVRVCNTFQVHICVALIMLFQIPSLTVPLLVSLQLCPQAWALQPTLIPPSTFGGETSTGPASNSASSSLSATPTVTANFPSLTGYSSCGTSDWPHPRDPNLPDK